jgi:nitrogenase molybdenum-iron protein beta chain
VESIILTDISQTMNTPVKLPKPHFPEGGTTKAEIVDLANSLGSIALCPVTGGTAARLLERKFSVPAVLGPTPIGVKNTETLVENIARLSGKEIPAEINHERGLLLDAIVDVHHYLYGRRVAIFGDPDIVAAIVRLVTEAGMKPVAVCTATASPDFAQQIKAVAEEYACPVEILERSDLFALNEVLKGVGAEVLIGNSKGNDLAEDHHIPLVRVGFPVYDRVGYFRYPIMGYNGSIHLLDMITNAILGHKYDQDKLHQ